MGAVGAAAPTIFCQWVQKMYSAPTIFSSKTPFSSIHKHRRSSMTKSFRNTRVNIAVKVVGKHVKIIRYRFYHSFMLQLEFVENSFTRAPSAEMGLDSDPAPTMFQTFLRPWLSWLTMPLSDCCYWRKGILALLRLGAALVIGEGLRAPPPHWIRPCTRAPPRNFVGGTDS